MIYVSLSLRYHRQLNLISPDVLESFFKEVAAAAKAYGGAVIPQGAMAVYAFDSKGLCCAFSVFLMVEAILKLAEERKERIKEYFVFVTSSEKNLSADEIADRMSSCDNIIIPDRAVVLTRESASLLSPYATFESIAGGSLLLFSEAKPFSGGVSNAAAFLSKPILLPFSAAKDKERCSLLLAFLNTASLLSVDFNPETFLTKKEAAAFAEDKKAVKRVAAMRFAATHPLYIIEACEDYLKLFFIALSRFYAESRGSETVELEVPEGSFSAKELAHFEELLRDICVFKMQKKDAYGKHNVNASEVPPDIMDAAFLYFRASGFLYAGEICSLLSFLGKGSSFREAIDSRLSAAGFPIDTAFFSCMQSLEMKGFPLESDKKRLDKYLFDYLLDQCKSGDICSSVDFYERLLTLKIRIPDSLLAAVAYSSPNPSATAAKELKDNFSNPGIAAAIKELAGAEKKLGNGDYRTAQTEAKRVLQVFQRAKILIGEFEAFSLLSRINFSMNNASFDEAFSYLNYALEGSVRMQNFDAQMRALFDIASMQFLSSNFFQAQNSVRQLREKADERYDKGQVFAACFLEGMIYFSLGDYVACEKIFAALEEACAPLGLEKAAPLSRAWVFRSKAYQAKKAPISEYRAELCKLAPEAALYALECLAKAAIEGERAQDAESLFCSLPAKIESVPQEGNYIPPDEWSWRSSFAFEEDKYFCATQAGAASLLYAAFYAFCSPIYGDKSISFAAARDSIASLVREKLPPNTPRAYILYCLCYELESRVTGKNSPEALSFLSRAFKNVQTLANNIDDTPMREKFLTRPYWNSLLYTAARENNLI